MKVKQFWTIIEKVHEEANGAMERKCELLKLALKKLSDEDLLSFSNHFGTLDADAYSWSLWGAAYVLHGGCSDDSFDDFRATLISRGRDTYEAALQDPNSLAQVIFDEGEVCFEGFQYVANDVLESRFGEIPPRTVAFPDSPSGEEWDEDSVEDLYPALKTIDNVEVIKSKPWWKFW